MRRILNCAAAPQLVTACLQGRPAYRCSSASRAKKAAICAAQSCAYQPDRLPSHQARLYEVAPSSLSLSLLCIPSVCSVALSVDGKNAARVHMKPHAVCATPLSALTRLTPSVLSASLPNCFPFNHPPALRGLSFLSYGQTNYLFSAPHRSSRERRRRRS